MNRPNIPSTVILNIGNDSALLHTRALLLGSAGYIITSTSSIREAIEWFQTGDFDLVVLCHSLSEQEREHLIRVIRKGGSAIPVLFVTAANVRTQIGLPI